MMMRFGLRLSLQFACLIGLSTPLWAPQPALARAKATSDSPAKTWIRGEVDRIKKLTEKRPKPKSPEEQALIAKLKTRASELIDWQTLGEASLGKPFQTLKADQQAAFIATLKQMIEASIADKLKGVSQSEADAQAKKVKLSWGEEKPSKGGLLIGLSAQKGQETVDLVFAIKPHGEGWRLWDVRIDEVSTVRTYRSQFRRIIQKEGFDGLMNRMKAKIADIEAGRASL